ncbi:unnamed protein product, partial [Pelagomonas calceolata]
PGLPPGKRRRAACWISRLHPITLITASTSTRENQTPNRASGPFFHHHISSNFCADSRAGGPGARDEGLTG